jgi:N-acetylglucosamine-6-sulfatase
MLGEPLGKIALIALLLASATPLLSGCGSDQVPRKPQVEDLGKPNIVLILADDMRYDDLEHMPKTQNLIVKEGLKYENAFATTPLCCPSRASILRGQYTHNHETWLNVRGFPTFKRLGHERSTIATWLSKEGYETALLGKYLNAYDWDDRQHVPPGWEEWRGMLTEGAYYDYTLSENGKPIRYGSAEADYFTDVLAGEAREIIRSSAGQDKPLFMYLAPNAPHGPGPPAPRHEGLFAEVGAPRPPSFDEADVSDKPGWIRMFPRLSADQKAYIDRVYRGHLRLLPSLDDLVADVVEELRSAGELENTYLFFSSDNGLLMGEHRILEGKGPPYEESIRVPLAVRGPGIPAGRSTDQIALNIDLAPTVADLGGAATPPFVDGRSLKPTFAQDAPSWRTAFLAESEYLTGQGGTPQHDTIRTAGGEKYVEYPSGAKVEQEYYQLTEDPYELENAYRSADPNRIEELRARLEALKSCSGAACRAADGAGFEGR